MKHRPIPRGAARGAAATALVTALVLIRLPHLGTGPLDFDEGVYWLSLRSMRAGNPLFTSVYSSQPPAFLLLAEPPWAWLGGSIAAARAVVLAWSVVAVGAGAILGWRLAGPVAGSASAVLLAADPRMVEQSLILQADGPATALALLALAAAGCAVTVERRHWRTLAAVCAGAAMALGILTKLFDVGVVPALIVLLLTSRRRWVLLGSTAAGALLASGVILLPMVDAWSAMLDQAVGVHVTTRGLYPGITLAYVRTFVGREWPLVLLAALGVLTGWRYRWRAWAVGVAWLAGAFAALLATRPVFQHHTVQLIPGLVILAATAIADVAGRLRTSLEGQARLALWSVAAVAGGVAGALLLEHTLARLVFPTNTALVVRLQALIPATALVFGDDQFDQALAARDAPPQLIDTSGVRLNGGRVTATALERDLRGDPRVCGVLFGAGRLSSVPGLVSWTSVRYPVRHTLPGGAVLYTLPLCRA